jgi:glycosyltransferase involved in cell wall biosynthesis
VPTSKCRLVVTVHDAAYFDEGAHEENFANIKQLVKWRTLYATLARRVDVFHTVSHFSADRLAATFPEIRSRLRVIHNAVSPEFFEPAGDSGKLFLEELDLRDRPYILVPGGLHYRKNAELILRVWPILRQRVPDLTLVIAGHSNPDYEVRARTMDQSIVFPGFVTDTCLRALYHSAQTVWFPSRYEGFGLPILEAMACGAVVVASNCSAVPEVAGGTALLADPDSAHDHADALESMIEDSQLRSDLQKRGKKRAARFKWDSVASKLHEVYSDLL